MEEKIAKSQEVAKDPYVSTRSPLFGEYEYASFTWANQGDNIIIFFNNVINFLLFSI